MQAHSQDFASGVAPGFTLGHQCVSGTLSPFIPLKRCPVCFPGSMWNSTLLV